MLISDFFKLEVISSKLIDLSFVKTAYEENPLPEETTKKRGRKKKSKVLNLISRLV